MPDWNYHPLIKPVLNVLPKSKAQNVALSGVRALGSNWLGRKSIDLMGHMAPPSELGVQIGSVRFPSRVFLGLSIDPLGVGKKAFAKFGFGALEISLDVATQNVSESKLPIPILPVIEISDFESKEFFNLAQSNKVFRISESMTEHIAKLDSDLCQHFLKKVRQSANELKIEFIFSFANLQKLQSNFEVLNILKNFNFTWIQLKASENQQETTLLIDKIQKLSFFKIILSGGISCPADYELYRNLNVEIICLDQEIFSAGPGLPKRLNQSEEFFRNISVSNDLQNRPATRMSWFWCFLMGLGMFVGSFMAILMSLTKVILPYDESISGITKLEIAQFNEKILHFMAHDRATLAGVMFSIGIMYMSFSWFGAKKGLPWYREAVLASALMGFLNFFCFLSYGYFDVLHAFVTACLFQIFIMAVYAYFPKQRILPQPMMTNSRTWKMGLVSQLLFVIQGVGLILAGAVITYFGATTVFVPQDLEYLGAGVEALKKVHSNLIPLIAHDRCTFGGMLISSGVLISLSALWGFEPRQRWLWWTYLVGGYPAYLVTLGIHSHIGYESFIHLLPVYIGLALLTTSLVLSYPYFFSKSKKA